MMMDLESEKWVPLVEFSVQRGISLSTLRRYIKSNKIPWKLIEGRYLVMDDGTITAPRNPNEHIRRLEQELAAAHEEVTELKMLVAFYDEKWAQTK